MTCTLCDGEGHEAPTFAMDDTERAWQLRVCAVMNEHPGLFMRHAIMTVQLEDRAAEARAAELAWEREKGRAYAEGMAEVLKS